MSSTISIVPAIDPSHSPCPYFGWRLDLSNRNPALRHKHRLACLAHAFQGSRRRQDRDPIVASFGSEAGRLHLAMRSHGSPQFVFPSPYSQMPCAKIGTESIKARCMPIKVKAHGALVRPQPAGAAERTGGDDERGCRPKNLRECPEDLLVVADAAHSSGSLQFCETNPIWAGPLPAPIHFAA